jgi:hypothetical protein
MTATITTAGSTTASPTRRVDRRHLVPTLAGVGYVGAWVVGLSAFGLGPAADATDAEVARYFDDHTVTSALQSTFIHGLAAVALVAVLVAVRRRAPLPRTAWVAGLAGATLSLMQWGLGMWRSLAASGSTTVDLVAAIDRIDGAKMLAFAVMIGTSLTALRSSGLIGRRLRAVGGVATVSLVAAAVAYGFAVDALTVAAEVALLGLLTFVAGIGIAAGRRSA